MKKIKAYAEDCLSDDTTVIVNDYPNPDGEPELAISTCLNDEFINVYRTIKEDGSIEFVILIGDLNSKKVARYVTKKPHSEVIKDGTVDMVFGMFGMYRKQYEEMSL